MRKSGLVFGFFIERGYGVNDEIGILFVFFSREGAGLMTKSG